MPKQKSVKTEAKTDVTESILSPVKILKRAIILLKSVSKSVKNRILGNSLNNRC